MNKNGRNSKVAASGRRFTRQMAYYETKIRQEIIASYKSPGHVNNVTF